MEEYRYTYLIMTLLFLGIWLFIFYQRKDLRNAMLITSFFSGTLGPFVAWIYLHDWWKPLTVTGTAIGIEDFLFAFTIAGIGISIYEEIFKKKLRPRKKSLKTKELELLHVFGLFIVGFSSFLIGFFIFNLNTLNTTILSLLIVIAIIYFNRPDLIPEGLATGIILIFLVSINYTILNLLTPGWIEAFWTFENTPKIIILNIPIDDLIWYFLVGMFMGTLYEFWQEEKLVDLK